MSFLRNQHVPCLFAALIVSVAIPIPDPVGLRAGETPIVEHPSRLVFPPLVFDPPEAASHRHVLPSGVVVYIVEDHELPLVDVSVTLRAGAYLDPAGKEGLAALTAGQLRAGGSEAMSPEDLDEELAFLAANVSAGAGDTEASVSLNCLSKDLDRVLDLYLSLLFTPRFDEKRLALKLSQELQELARRNDSTASIESREWERLLRGDGFFSTDRRTKTSLGGITRSDLRDFHRRHYRPRNLIVAVSGDVSTQAVREGLEKRFAPFSSASDTSGLAPVPPRPTHAPVPGAYLVDKPDVNQGRVSLGHPSLLRDHPDFHALNIMNQILGGGGFTSRIMNRVRSDKGLAYSAGSRFEFGVYYPGDFRCFFQSKSESVSEALSIVLGEIERIRSEKVSDEELSTARNYAIGIFPRFFATAQIVASTFASDEFTGRDPGFWKSYCGAMRAVTADDVLRVAREQLRPERLVVLLVGKGDDILKADRSGTIAKLSGAEGPRSIPLPEPLELRYPSK